MDVNKMAIENLADTTILGSLGLGWVLNYDWLMIIATVVGILTLVCRFLEWQQQKRTNDLKERELNKMGG